VILRWLIERYRCEVVAFCADLARRGAHPRARQGAADGAAAVHIVDLREEFVRDFIFPMLRANAVYEAPISWALRSPAAHRARPGRDRRQEGAERSPTAPREGNDQVRFEFTYAALAPHLRVIAPWREWELNSRTALIEFANRHDIPCR